MRNSSKSPIFIKTSPNEQRESDSIPRLQYPTIPNPDSTNTELSSTPENWSDSDILLSTPARHQSQRLDIAEMNEVEDELMPSSHSPMSASFRSPVSSQKSTEFKAPFTQCPNDSPMSIAQDSPALSHVEDVFMLSSTQNSSSALPSTPPENPPPPSQSPSLSHDPKGVAAVGSKSSNPQTPPSPSPQSVNGSAVKKPVKRRARMKQGLFLPSPHDKDWKWQAKLAAGELLYVYPLYYYLIFSVR